MSMGIKRLLQKSIGWDRKSDLAKELTRYRAYSLVARAIALLPIPLWVLLRASRSSKERSGWHSYGHTYEQLFRRWKYRRVKLLEVGIGGYDEALGGRSLLAWLAYFPFGTIIAGDIQPKQELAGNRRRIYQLDQSSAKDLAALCLREERFDLIIDDGSHVNAHQIFTFQQLFHALSDGGVYVVEDVQTSFWPFWPDSAGNVPWDGARIGDPSFRQTCYGYFLELTKYLNHVEFIDQHGVDESMLLLGTQITRITFEHNLIIVLKGDNSRRSAFIKNG
ncbi:MAG: class I SAM-dependent methyltransferase [Acetobacteraceae bacterium]